MKVIGKIARKAPQVMEIPNELSVLQEFVEGYIEVVPLAGDVLLIVNEEGRLMNLPINFWLCTHDSKVIDCIRGNVLVVGRDGEEFCSLTEEQIEHFKNMLGTSLVFGVPIS